MNLAKRNSTSKKHISLIDSDNLNQLISQEHSSLVNKIKIVKDKEEVVIDDILDMLTGKEFFR